MSSPQTQPSNDTGSLSIVATGSEGTFAALGAVSAKAVLSRNGQIISFDLAVVDEAASGSIDKVYVGNWTLAVYIKDSEGIILYSGQSQIRVKKDQVSEAAVVLETQPGILNLSIDLSLFPQQEEIRKARLYLDGVEAASMEITDESPQLETTIEIAPKSYDLKVSLYGETLHPYNLIYEGQWERIDIYPGLQTDVVWSPGLGGVAVTGSIDASPEAPSGLTATVTGSAVDLAWNPVVDFEGDLNGYRIYGRKDEFDMFATLADVGSTVTAWQHVPEEWVPQTTWEYAVTSLDLAGHESLRSDTVQVTLW